MKRAAALVAILVGGLLCLPLAALPFGDGDNENWILPLALLITSAVGVGAVFAVPSLAGQQPSPGRKTALGVAYGIGGAVIGLLIFWLLLNGFDGA